jgi:hypothetical protein
VLRACNAQTEMLKRSVWPAIVKKPLQPADDFGRDSFMSRAGDMHRLVALRVPMTNEQAEFDGLVLSPTKLLNDSINDKQLALAFNRRRASQRSKV